MGRLVVLGASGWLGSAVAAAAKTLDPATTTPTRADLGDCGAAALRDVLKPADDLTVLNLVGLVRGTPQQFDEANRAFALSLVDALAGTGAYLVHAGSPAEYGDPGSADPIPETHPLLPVTDYGRSKAVSSEAVLAQPGWCVLRPFNVIDADMTPTNPAAIIREQVRTSIAAGTPVTLPAAQAIRDHISRSFVARSFIHAATHHPVGAFNLCSGIGVSYAETARAIAAALGSEIEIIDENRPGVRTVVGDPTAWASASGLAEQMDAQAIATLVLR